jgi:hypothetical protein
MARVPAIEFKAKCRELMDRVAEPQETCAGSEDQARARRLFQANARTCLDLEFPIEAAKRRRRPAAVGARSLPGPPRLESGHRSRRRPAPLDWKLLTSSMLAFP